MLPTLIFLHEELRECHPLEHFIVSLVVPLSRIENVKFRLLMLKTSIHKAFGIQQKYVHETYVYMYYI